MTSASTPVEPRRRYRSVRAALLVIVLISVVPSFLYSLYTIFAFGRSEQQALDGQLSFSVRALAQAVDADLAVQHDLGVTISLTPEVQKYDQPAFSDMAEGLMRRYPWLQILVIEPGTHRVLFHTQRVTLDQPMIASGIKWIDRVVATGEPQVSDIFFGRLRRAPSISTYVPILRDGVVWRVLALSADAGHFQKIFEENNLQKDSGAGLIDGNNVFIARAVDPEDHVGRPAPPDIRENAMRSPSGIFNHISSEGLPSRIAWSRITKADWVVAVAVRDRAHRIALMQSIKELAAGWLAVLALGIGLGLWLAWDMARQSRALAHQAAGLIHGAPRATTRYDIDELAQIGAALGEARSELDRRMRAQQELLHSLEDRVNERTQAVLESEKRYRLVADNSSDLIAILCAQGCARYVSPSASRLLGLAPEALQEGGLVTALAPEDRPLLRQAIDQLNGTTETRVLILRAFAADGTPLWLEAAMTGLVDPDGAGWLGALIVARDISERREAELRAVAALNEAQQANRAKSLFLASMSHELRTPLNAVIGFAELLKLQTVAPLAERQIVYLDHILTAGTNLLRLISDILEFAKLESGTLRIEPRSVRIAELLDEAVAMMQELAEDRRVTVVVTMDRLQSDLQVEADPGRLLQILTNLISNGIKYNNAGGRVEIAVGVEPDGFVRVTIRDDGIGIPRARHSEVFQAFNRLGAEAGTIEGTGLGLSLCRRLIEDMGGEIGFDSDSEQVPRGCLLWFRLPRSCAAMVGPAPRSAETVRT